MDYYNKLLVQKLESLHEDVFWQGAASIDQIDTLEQELKLELSKSFRTFLEILGGGGIVDEEISGIENNNVSLKTGGTVLRDTLECRKLFSLPDYLAVIYYKDQEVVWCLDTSKRNNEECPVVAFDVFSKEISNKIANNFDAFFKEYLELRTAM